MKQLLEAASNEFPRYQAEWQTARKTFLGLLADFEARRSVLLQAEQAALDLDDCRHRLDEQVHGVQALSNQVELARQRFASQKEAQLIQHATVQSCQASLNQLQTQHMRTLWDALCAMVGFETARVAARRRALERPTAALTQATQALVDGARHAAITSAQLDQARQSHRDSCAQRQLLELEHRDHQRAVQTGLATGAEHFPDARFWALSAAERHRAAVAVSPDLDHLRARIFLQAMELHRLTVLACAGKFIGNLRMVNAMLTGAVRDKLLMEHRTHVWDAFFFVVPVVSTTLASFDRLFTGMGQDSLGWLLIDEAGQATPQSAAGAIWRSQRAVLVGDPLQIEPVFTTPLGLVDEFRRRHGVAAMWSPNDESVQTLADRVTRYGSWVATTVAPGAADDSRVPALWTGMPLRTHRRCDDPMFTVANQIAYAGQMVAGPVDDMGRLMAPEFSCVLQESAWLNVSATRSQHPVVEDELDVLVDCLQALARQPDSTLPTLPAKRAKAPKIFVISPFRKVKNACIARIRQAGLSGIDCGTVHTFQGKEAEIVFLVLGTAPGPTGAGARAWASSKPNLLNVAITRAKRRLYVIGDAAQWGQLDHFAELRESLPLRQQRSHDSLYSRR